MSLLDSTDILDETDRSDAAPSIEPAPRPPAPYTLREGSAFPFFPLLGF